MTEAVAENFELRAAARVHAARAQARIAGADLQPRLQATAGAGCSDRFELQGQVSREADLRGRLSDDARAARADPQAAERDLARAPASGPSR